MNVLNDALRTMRLRFWQRCWIIVLTIAAYVTLFIVDWRVALAVFALECARNTATAMGRTQ